ncbi:MAG: hypothetical protein EBX40_01995 [Gammaproteobacteria bacterium]|nr:hypothetical protein [Gammaproteobacteria bacterium]
MRRKEKQEMMFWAALAYSIGIILTIVVNLRAEASRPIFLVDVKKGCSVYQLAQTTAKVCPKSAFRHHRNTNHHKHKLASSHQ